MALLHFALFELDTTRGELLRQGRRIRIAAQPLNALSLLASRPGELISRDELRRHLWGDHTFVDFDRGLNFAVAEIRAALNDDARSPRFVETVPRRGYRFIADVRTEPVAVAPAPAARTFHTLRRWAWAAAIPLLVAQLPESARVHSRLTALPEARAAFERGLEATSQGVAGARRGIHAFRQASRLDPRFAEAQYALADTYLTLADRRELPAGPALAEARAAALLAVSLEDVAESRQLLGTVRLLSDWDWSGARRDLARAVALAPSWDGGLVAYARVLSAAGDDRGALELIDRAETLSPSCDLILWESGLIHARASRVAEAARKLEAAITFGPPHGRTPEDWQRQIRFRRLMLYAGQGDWSAAHADALAILDINGASDGQRARFAGADARPAVTRFLENSASRMTDRLTEERGSPTRIAAVHAALGHDEAAIQWLERAAADGDPDLLFSLRDPEFGHLRAHQRFRALAERVFHPSLPFHGM